MLKWVAVILVLGVIVVLLRRSAPSKPRTLAFDPIPGITLSALEITNTGPERSFNIEYTGGADTPRFAFRYNPKAPPNDSPFVITRGALSSRAGSRPATLLRALAQAHGAVPEVHTVTRVDRLEVDVALLGEHLTRGRGNHVIAGEFTDDSPGPWIVTKLFVPSSGEEPAEIFLALNPDERRAEFLVKDTEYWPLLARSLASVL
jgi:hypothetical protein